MGKRLTGFDYSRALFYMVTIKCHEGVMALSEIVAPGRCQMNAITRAMVNCIRNFHLGCRAIAPIECFSIMPDHIHLLIRIGEQTGAKTLGDAAFIPLRLEAIVGMLMQALEGRYAEVTGRREEVFDASWHDWIVVAEGQLAAFTRYIRENPKRAWLRRENRRFFSQVRRVSFAGRAWFAYGNAALLELPVIESFRCSRKWAEGGVEWREAVGRASRIGPGGAGAGTFMSPCEKLCGNEIFKAGGALIVLSPEGFGPRWHPPRNKEALCAKGRMLFLSLWEPQAARPDNATLYRRCHEMGDAIVGAKRLGRSKTLMQSATERKPLCGGSASGGVGGSLAGSGGVGGSLAGSGGVGGSLAGSGGVGGSLAGSGGVGEPDAGVLKSFAHT